MENNAENSSPLTVLLVQQLQHRRSCQNSGAQTGCNGKRKCQYQKVSSFLILMVSGTVPSFHYKLLREDILAGSVKMTVQILSVPASMSHTFCYCAREFILGHPRGLSENDSKSCCHFQKACEDVPIQGFTALWLRAPPRYQ